MKKFAVILLILLLTFYTAACGGSGNNDLNKNQTNETAAAGRPDTGESQISSEAPLDILSNVWNSYDESEKFPAMGGDMTEDGSVDNAPGNLSIDNAGELDRIFGFPPDSIDKIDAAASLVNLFNTNTFTCGAYHVKDINEIDAICKDIENSISGKQWLCGFPEKLVIITVGDCIVSIYGHSEPVDTFVSMLNQVYTSADVFCDKPLLRSH